jgi:nitrogen fixation/metabolism regulation signal transduction histidine kinase
MVLAMSTGLEILALVGLLVALVVLLIALALFNRVVRPIFEINRYAKDILDGGIGIAKNVDGVDELARTRDLVISVPPLAVAYLEIVKKELP